MGKLGQLLVARSWITVQQLTRALQNQNAVGGRLGTCLLEMEVLGEDLLVRSLSEQQGVPAAGIEDLRGVPDEVLRLIPEKLARRCRAIPFRVAGGRLDVAMQDPRNLVCQDEIAFACGKRVKVHVLHELRIYEALQRYYREDCPSRYSLLLDRLNRARYMWSGAAAPPAPGASTLAERAEVLSALPPDGLLSDAPNLAPPPLPEPSLPPSPRRRSLFGSRPTPTKAPAKAADAPGPVPTATTADRPAARASKAPLPPTETVDIAAPRLPPAAAPPSPAAAPRAAGAAGSAGSDARRGSSDATLPPLAELDLRPTPRRVRTLSPDASPGAASGATAAMPARSLAATDASHASLTAAWATAAAAATAATAATAEAAASPAVRPLGAPPALFTPTSPGSAAASTAPPSDADSIEARAGRTRRKEKDREAKEQLDRDDTAAWTSAAAAVDRVSGTGAGAWSGMARDAGAASRRRDGTSPAPSPDRAAAVPPGTDPAIVSVPAGPQAGETFSESRGDGELAAPSSPEWAAAAAAAGFAATIPLGDPHTGHREVRASIAANSEPASRSAGRADAPTEKLVIADTKRAAEAAAAAARAAGRSSATAASPASGASPDGRSPVGAAAKADERGAAAPSSANEARPTAAATANEASLAAATTAESDGLLAAGSSSEASSSEASSSTPAMLSGGGRAGNKTTSNPDRWAELAALLDAPAGRRGTATPGGLAASASSASAAAAATAAGSGGAGASATRLTSAESDRATARNDSNANTAHGDATASRTAPHPDGLATAPSAAPPAGPASNGDPLTATNVTWMPRGEAAGAAGEAPIAGTTANRNPPPAASAAWLPESGATGAAGEASIAGTMSNRDPLTAASAAWMPQGEATDAAGDAAPGGTTAKRDILDIAPATWMPQGNAAGGAGDAAHARPASNRDPLAAAPAAWVPRGDAAYLAGEDGSDAAARTTPEAAGASAPDDAARGLGSSGLSGSSATDPTGPPPVDGGAEDREYAATITFAVLSASRARDEAAAALKERQDAEEQGDGRRAPGADSGEEPSAASGQAPPGQGANDSEPAPPGAPGAPAAATFSDAGEPADGAANDGAANNEAAVEGAETEGADHQAVDLETTIVLGPVRHRPARSSGADWPTTPASSGARRASGEQRFAPPAAAGQTAMQATQAPIEADDATGVAAAPLRAAPATLAEVEAAFSRTTDLEEVGRILLGFLAHSFRRVALFQVNRRLVTAWMAQGEDIDQEAFGRYTASFSEPSLFLNLRQGNGIHMGPLPPMAAHRELALCWGGGLPRDCIMVPVRLRERLVTVVYVDGGSRGLAGIDFEQMQQLTAATAAAFERCILSKKHGYAQS